MKDMFQPDSLLMCSLSRLCDLMLLNLLFIVLSFTVVLSGAALTALYSQTLKMVKDEEDSVVKDYLLAVKKNFLPSFPATIMLFIEIMLLLIVRCALHSDVLIFPPTVFFFICILCSMLTAFLSWLFPLIARYEAGFGTQCKNAVSLAVVRLPLTFLLVFVNLFPILVGLRFPQLIGYLLGIWLLLGFGVSAYINAWYIRRCFELFDRNTISKEDSL